ncbi:phosphoribosylformylglycinamidine synthase [uncultured Brachyspira sp.]|uniref:phosphoribosylformylglycinamidine synthase n=2 Tax=uncultured Brachyspira sp. TaxID=221953 RepID=UPI0025CF21C4|nr:phosphoribosylformylglycinamidine synthase [uncultured Brachyspira sp.]
MNYRIFIEKKEGFDLEAKRLENQLKENFKIKCSVRLLNVYDIFNIEENQLNNSIKVIFSEPPTDKVVEKKDFENLQYFAVEYLPGQFDQRADSALQCLKLIYNDIKDTVIVSGKIIVFDGEIDEDTIEKIKKFYINPVESREKDLSKLEIEPYQKADSIKDADNFINFNTEELYKYKDNLDLAMTYKDIEFVQDYFKNEEKRNPTETEIKVLDTYWSDHCRHTTFMTKINNVKLENDKSSFSEIILNTINRYNNMRKEIYGEDADKRDINLMDMATISAKYIKKKGKLEDLEISEEINACSIYIDVDASDENGKSKTEKYLLMFKNETHNHPTEIEPFGGASTCLGGAIRDPLSGRSYVYQAVRVTGSANPLEKLEDTLPGKLPQKKITSLAAAGYSSYGNQIGLATCLVNEIYDEGYKAKRLEVGAVVGAVPVNYVRREKPKAGDIVIVLGGRTGRDGCGGATGSSKSHTDTSLRLCGCEVQKGNAPEERKIQRLFRNKEALKLIKKCNDFGAGGVSVAMGELSEGIDINLDVLPVKYLGLNGTELAISESQERMAAVVESRDADNFIKLANEENIEAEKAAVITDTGRLVMYLKGIKIADISRKFLDTNGAKQSTDVLLKDINFENNPFSTKNACSLKYHWFNMMEDLNVASQKGLAEMFDSSIGASTVLMPFGGKYQMTPIDVSIQKIPIFGNSVKEINTASAITWGYNPSIMKWSEFHGGIYSVIESMSKLVCAGADYKNIRLSFQEYFEKLGNDAVKWGKVYSALLGTIYVQSEFDIPAIGGKDSMSGTFNNISVPSTLISFAVSTVNSEYVISPEFKSFNNYVYLIKHNMKENYMPNIEEIKENFSFMHENIKNRKILSAYAIKFGGIAEAVTKMAFGNRIGIDIKEEHHFFNLMPASFIVETKEEIDYKNAVLIGKTIDKYKIRVCGEVIDLEEIEKSWLEKLSSVFPYKTYEDIETYPASYYEAKTPFICKNKKAKPNVLIASFLGTNCEYDTQKAFYDSGAHADIFVFRNIKPEYIKESIEYMSKKIDNSQIFMIPGGFSAADEPDGSGKFISAILSNEKIKTSIYKLLERDGLILGICNGFQALIKSGLLPYGRIGDINENSPTLTFNKIGRHISQMVTVKVMSNNSPWLYSIPVGSELVIPVSHGEGRFFADEGIIEELIKKGQVATQYVNFKSVPTNEFRFNPNGSVYAVEGILSEDGKIFGKMGHSERYGNNLYKNTIAKDIYNIFENGVNYFK